MSRERRLPVLTYHRVGPPAPGTNPELTIAPEQFERQMTWLADHGYAGVSASDCLCWFRGMSELPSKPVLLSFDDGYVETAEFVVPVLRRLNFSAVVFIVTGQLGGTNSWKSLGRGTFRLMNAEQIRACVAAGIEIGAHSRTHPDLTTLDVPELQNEVAGSSLDLTSVLGAAPPAFAYPYGFFDDKVKACATEHFSLAFTTMDGLNSRQSDPMTLRRTMVQPTDGLLIFSLRLRLGFSPLEGWRSRLRLRTRLRRALERL